LLYHFFANEAATISTRRRPLGAACNAANILECYRISYFSYEEYNIMSRNRAVPALALGKTAEICNA